jgi:hypothetical protein
MAKERCICGAYDCGLCYPSTYKKFIRQENEEDDEESGEPEEDEDIIRYRKEGRER